MVLEPAPPAVLQLLGYPVALGHGDLLTLATPPEVAVLREWVFAEMLRQLDGHAPQRWTGQLG